MNPAELLKKFINPGHLLTKSVWKNGGKAIATNAYTLVTAPIWDGSLPDAPAGVVRIVTEMGLLSTPVECAVSDIRSILADVPFKMTPVEVECGLCEGSGKYTDMVSYKGHFYDIECDCPVCNGSGTEDSSTGETEKTYGEKQRIQFDSVPLFPQRIEELISVIDDVGVESVSVFENAEKRQVFLKVGEYEVLLMGAMITGDEEIRKVTSVREVKP